MPMTTQPRTRLRSALRGGLAAFALAAATVQASPARAHPHVWVSAETEVVFDAQRRVTALRHFWTFDEMYSSWAVQDAGGGAGGTVDQAQLQALAEENALSLHEFGYFTEVKANGVEQSFGTPVDYRMTYENGKLTLSFTLPLAAPAEAERALALEVSDPEFFVSFRMAEGDDAVRLVGGPDGCAKTISRPADIGLESAGSLSEDFFLALTEAADFSERIANRALIACP